MPSTGIQGAGEKTAPAEISVGEDATGRGGHTDHAKASKAGATIDTPQPQNGSNNEYDWALEQHKLKGNALMELRRFRIRKFRSIQDSGDVEISDPLTCIVGKNQAGKTALLRALHKFNPHAPDPYDMRREWPRGERTTKDERQVVCEVEFGLNAHEQQQLGELIDTAPPQLVIVTKDYGGRFEVTFPEAPDLFPNKLHPSTITAACEQFSQFEPGPEVGEEFMHAAKTSIEEAVRLGREGRYEELSGLADQQKERLEALRTPGEPQPLTKYQNRFIGAHTERLRQIQAELATSKTVQQRAHEFVIESIPTFIYMSDYKTFRGSARLDVIRDRLQNPANPLDEADETFQMILKLAGLDLDELIRQGQSGDRDIVHDRQLDLQDAALTLTRDVAGRWGQAPYRIEFRADGQTFFTDIEQVDKQIGMIPLEEQSKGFQWFFSFDLHFMHDSQGKFEGCVLLLDEPGLHLHPGGQADLLARLDAYAKENTTIYTTHLPFLIDLREPSRIRVITQDDKGTAVTSHLNEAKDDERLTLQAALGMKANQSYLVAQRNLLVEGVDDQWIVTALANVLERAGEAILPDDVMVTATGSASHIVHTATFMIGQRLDVLALFDSDDAGKREESVLRKKWLTRYNESSSDTLLLGTALGMSECTIEDLFADEYYLEKLRASHAEKLRALGKAPADLVLSGGGPVLPRVERACELIGLQFNKGSVAKLIRAELNRATSVSSLPPVTVERARKLLLAIAQHFVRERSD